LNEEVFYFTQGTRAPNLAGRQPSLRRVVSSVNYGTNGKSWSGLRSNQQYAVRWWGDLNILTREYYYFRLESDDGSRIYVNNQWWVNNDHYNSVRSTSSRRYMNPGKYQLRVEYWQISGNNRMRFWITTSNGQELTFNGNMVAACTQTSAGDAHLDRSFFTDLNGDGLMNYKDGVSVQGNEFPLRDIYAQSRIYSPAGGINTEFIDKDGNACDIFKLKQECKPADAGDKEEGALVNYLAKFCDVPAALYQVPVQKDGKVPADFGAVTFPMPIRGYGAKSTNYRAQARAEFGKMGNGTFLFCQPGMNDCKGNPPLAVQGVFNGIEDERVWSAGDVLKAKFYPQTGGSTAGNIPSVVNTKWTQAGTLASGVFNNDILVRYRRSKNEGTLYAKDRVQMDRHRREGVTCLNGKYVYARKNKDGSRPIVSTVREALNRNGPLANGQWSCRYVGVHCNANNCNNNGNTEVAGPFVEPKIRAKKVKPTLPPTTAPPTTEAPTPVPATTAAPQPAGRRRAPSRRRRRGASRRRSGRRRRGSASKSKDLSGKGSRRRRRRAKKA
jgi:hypothetical protein